MPEYTENYKGYEINIILDEWPENPFTDFDGEPPIVVNYNRGLDTYGEDVNRVPYLDKADLKRALSVILELTGKRSIYDLVREVRQHSTDLLAGIHWELTDAINDLDDSERLEALCSLYNALGIPAVVKAVRGYCQGDYAEVLAVATPEFQAECGCAEGYNWFARLNGSIKLFGDCAFGNVYGYKIVSPSGETDSLFGFYGDYDAEYGALPEARAAVDNAIKWDRKQHCQQLKTWIRNHVPLTHRKAMA